MNSLVTCDQPSKAEWHVKCSTHSLQMAAFEGVIGVAIAYSGPDVSRIVRTGN